MAATVLLTTGDENALFLEEPESHLHAGAQRFLIEKLREGKRQVLITTHSQTFVNLTGARSLYKVTNAQGRTKIDRIGEAESLGTVLEDIGARNSDVLLSDSVLFVEGKTDQQALSIWSEKLDVNLAERNITMLAMGGGEFADRYAPARSNLLADISQSASVPHLFVLDRDQRTLEDISKLKQKLGGVFTFSKHENLKTIS